MDEYTLLGTQMIITHARLRDMLDDLRDGLPCLEFCTLLTEHHTDEDDNLFPRLAARHPQLREFLDELRRDHLIIAQLLKNGEDDREALAAVLETHFTGEEKRLTALLNELGRAS
ncbi:hemerythrin domain-containing protein [Paractinoplanes globisporus]|uniref:Hemerythrin domain-containing protein n=1 Tax=Paractinoplanes globisporus TaxID=113565 RepID=A0ABW6WQ62_9ACTN|nr:hemerythrin domain-containing protein [Actinoplanes globisporus]